MYKQVKNSEQYKRAELAHPSGFLWFGYISVWSMVRVVWRRLTPLTYRAGGRKPFIFLWKFMLRNAGIGSGSNPAFHTLKNE